MFLFSAFALFFFPQISFAQEVAPTLVTPTLYCLGSCPTDGVVPTTNTTAAPVISTTGTTGIPTDAQTTTAVPTENPCDTGTVSIQHWHHHKDSNGAIGSGMEDFLKLLKQLIELIMQLLGGGKTIDSPTTPTPEPTTAPAPCNPTPTTGTEEPTTAPTTGQATTAPTIAASPSAATTPPATTGTTPVGINGQLHVCGNKLCNQFNKPIQLRGVSTHGLQWHYNCINDASFTALANDWKADVVRLAMYVDEGGYTTDPAGFRQKVDTAVDLAAAKGMYVLIDWHILNPGDPNVHVAEAKEFFDYMSKKHGNQPSVFYEIANEPNGVTWDQVKTYANQIIPAIRANDPDNIIIVGTPGYSSINMVGGQSTDVVTGSPATGTNLMYAFHFYAASHTEDWRNKVNAAADKLPIFATEWGTPTYSGDGGNDLNSAKLWLDMFASKGISWATWNFSDDGQSSALLSGGTCPNGPYSTGNLKESGTFVREHMLTPADNFPTQ
jgi:endoglucanase